MVGKKPKLSEEALCKRLRSIAVDHGIKRLPTFSNQEPSLDILIQKIVGKSESVEPIVREFFADFPYNTAKSVLIHKNVPDALEMVLKYVGDALYEQKSPQKAAQIAERLSQSDILKFVKSHTKGALRWGMADLCAIAYAYPDQPNEVGVAALTALETKGNVRF